MSVRKTKFRFPKWQCPKAKDKFVQITHTLLNHQSFTTLKRSSQMLYIYMRDYSNGKKEFVYPYKIYKNILSKQGFQQALKVLIEHGFIEIKASGKNTRTENIYEFSSKWIDYILPKNK